MLLEFLPIVTKAFPTFFIITVLPAEGELGNVIVKAVLAWLAINWSLFDAVYVVVFIDQSV